LKTLLPTAEPDGDVQALAFSPDGATLAVARRNSLAMFRVETWQPVAPTRTPSDKFTTFASIAYSPDGAQFALAGAFQAAEVWPLAGQAEPVLMDVKVDTRTRRRPPRLVTSLAFGADGETLAGAVGYEIKLWNAANGQEKRSLRGHEASVSAVDFSADGKRLASADEAGTIFLWNAETGRREFALYAHGRRAVSSLDFGPNGNFLVTGLDKGRVTIWSVFTGKRKISLTPHFVLNRVIATMFSRDGKMLATASEDGEMYLWSLPESP
jgi:WD40 repeat protein